MPYCAHCGTPAAEISYAPCTKCGRATNGALRPAGGDQASKAILIVIGVAIGGLIIIFMIGVLAAIAIPNFITAKERATQKRTMADMRAVGMELERYHSSHGVYPLTVGDLDVPRVDGWKRVLKYECTSADTTCDGYILASAGKDGRFEFDSLRDYNETSTENFNCDIVYANGSFVQYPEGAQK